MGDEPQRNEQDKGQGHARWAEYKADRLKQIEAGTWAPLIPSRQVREHLDELLALGMNMRAISDKTGVSVDRISIIMSGKQTSVRRAIAEPLLQLQLVGPYTDEGRIDAIYALRRLWALMAIGWPRHAMAKRLDVGNEYLRGLERAGRRTITLELHEKIKALYEELKDTEGPRNQARLDARAKEYPPPSAWAEGELDDPEPTILERARARARLASAEPHSGLILFDARESAGMTRKEVALELNVAESSVRRWEAGVLPWKKYRGPLAKLLDMPEDKLFPEPEPTTFAPVDDVMDDLQELLGAEADEAERVADADEDGDIEFVRARSNA